MILEKLGNVLIVLVGLIVFISIFIFLPYDYYAGRIEFTCKLESELNPSSTISFYTDMNQRKNKILKFESRAGSEVKDIDTKTIKITKINDDIIEMENVKLYLRTLSSEDGSEIGALEIGRLTGKAVFKYRDMSIMYNCEKGNIISEKKF